MHYGERELEGLCNQIKGWAVNRTLSLASKCCYAHGFYLHCILSGFMHTVSLGEAAPAQEPLLS